MTVALNVEALNLELVLVTKSESGPRILVPLAVLIGLGGAYIITTGALNPIYGICALAFAILIPILVWANVSYQKRLVINEDGIVDSRLGVGLIPWSDILEAHLESKYNNAYICLKVRSPEKFLDRLPQEKRSRVLNSHKLGFTHFNVSISGVDVNPIDLLQLVRDYSEKNRPRNI
jgi:hypothetical protein